MEPKSLAAFQDFNMKHFTQKFVYKNDGNSVFILNFLPGQIMNEHKHLGKEVYFHVLQGEGTLLNNGNEIKVSKNDILHISGSDYLGFVNTGSERVSIYVVLSNTNQQYSLRI
jgi:quercetin dioxygenase-like cupin family protein